MILSDVSAERAILSGLLEYGEEILLDIVDIIQEESFTIDSNQYIFKCCKHILETEQNIKSIDLASVYSASQDLGISHILNNIVEKSALRSTDVIL
jgi:replicative DNA helicase